MARMWHASAAQRGAWPVYVLMCRARDTCSLARLNRSQVPVLSTFAAAESLPRHTDVAVLATSSSRSQVATRTVSGAACVTCGRQSVGVRQHPSLALGAVTHFVTRSADLDCGGHLPLRRSSPSSEPAAETLIGAGSLVLWLRRSATLIQHREQEMTDGYMSPLHGHWHCNGYHKAHYRTARVLLLQRYRQPHSHHLSALQWRRPNLSPSMWRLRW